MHALIWVVVIIAVVVLGVSFYGSLAITDIPMLAVPYTPKDFGWTFEDVTFPSKDGTRLEGWFVPAAKPSDTTILVLHGVGSNHGDMLLNSECLHDDGRWNLFYYNFRGHGASEGHLTSLGPLELLDLEGALTFIKAWKPEACKHLAIYGHSLGAAVAIVAASQHPEIEAVAAESPFSSISLTVRRFAKMYHGLPYFPFVPLAILFASLRLRLKLGRFAPVDVIGKISPRPILLIQGGRDLRIPMSDFQTLWAAAREPKEQFLVPGADHGDPILIDKPGFDAHLTNFFRKALA